MPKPKHDIVIFVAQIQFIHFSTFIFLCMLMHNKNVVLKPHIIEINRRRDEYSIFSRFTFFVGLKKTLTRYSIINLLILSFFYLVTRYAKWFLYIIYMCVRIFVLNSL